MSAREPIDAGLRSATRDRPLVDYEQDWRSMRVLADWSSRVAAAARRVVDHRARYMAVAETLSIPWQIIGCIHLLEGGGDFATCLHNGERIIGTGAKTRLVPAGRGPFETWEEAAVDALADFPAIRTIGEALRALENFNGKGYLSQRKRSPYLWSGSNHGIGVGKYVADGMYDPMAVSNQVGAACILWGIAAIGFFSPVFGATENPLPLIVYDPRNSSADAHRLQEFLDNVGLYRGAQDGKPGPLTSDGVRRALGHYLSGDPRA